MEEEESPSSEASPTVGEARSKPPPESGGIRIRHPFLDKRSGGTRHPPQTAKKATMEF